MLDKDTLAKTIEVTMRIALANPEDSITNYAQALAAAIEEYVKGAEIVYKDGLTAPDGAVSGVFNGNLE